MDAGHSSDNTTMLASPRAQKLPTMAPLPTMSIVLFSISDDSLRTSIQQQIRIITNERCNTHSIILLHLSEEDSFLFFKIQIT